MRKAQLVVLTGLVILAAQGGAAQTGTLTFTSVTVGDGHACAIAGTGELYCWGRSNLKQGGFQGDKKVPTLARADLASSWLSASAGSLHTCAVRRDYRVFCWGDNSKGQLATGSTSTIGELPAGPVTGGLSFLRVAAGGTHTCGVQRAAGYVVIAGEPVIGKLYCWGDNSSGSVGNSLAGRNVTAPVVVSGGLNYTTVRAGERHTCAILYSGTAANKGSTQCWGLGAMGQLGNGTFQEFSLVPTAIKEGSTLPFPIPRFRSIGVSTVSSCGVAFDLTTPDALTYCWGDLLGLMPPTSVPSPLPGNLRLSRIEGGSVHSCGLTSTGTAYCWGSNSRGQLGTGSTSSGPPAVVAGNHKFQSLALGAYSTCGITTNGVLMCWGSNEYGQLGIGTVGGESRVPVKVALQP